MNLRSSNKNYAATASTRLPRPAKPLQVGELDNASAAVGDSAVSSTAPTLGELERLPPNKGGVPRDEPDRDPAEVAHFSPLKTVGAE
jgi:hypothetical protein